MLSTVPSRLYTIACVLSIGCVHTMILCCGVLSRSGLTGWVVNMVLDGYHPPDLGSGVGGAVRAFLRCACLDLL